MREGVLGVHPNVHAASQANKDALGVSTPALSTQLDRGETAVSAALVRDAAELAEPVVQLTFRTLFSRSMIVFEECALAKRGMVLSHPTRA
jgi:hypothetical protein